MSVDERFALMRKWFLERFAPELLSTLPEDLVRGFLWLVSVNILKYINCYIFRHWQELEGYDIISHVDKTRAYGFRAFRDSKLRENMGH